jgi:hypothetical protein
VGFVTFVSGGKKLHSRQLPSKAARAECWQSEKLRTRAEKTRRDTRCLVWRERGGEAGGASLHKEGRYLYVGGLSEVWTPQNLRYGRCASRLARWVESAVSLYQWNRTRQVRANSR